MSLIRRAYKQVSPYIQRVLDSQHAKTIEREIKTRLEIPIRFNSGSRQALEQFILPNLASQIISHRKPRILFVGCDWYTQHYKYEFFKECEYWTIDPDGKKKRYGSKNHITGYIELLKTYFEPEFFDMIICNGVIGYGLNQLQQVEEAFDSCFSCLRPGAKLIIGRENEPAFIPFSNSELESLKKFLPYQFHPLAAVDYSIPPHNTYVFSFFEKPTHSLGEVPQNNVVKMKALHTDQQKTVDHYHSIEAKI